MRRRRLRLDPLPRFLGVAVAFALLLSPSMAQDEPIVPHELLDNARQWDGNELRVCINAEALSSSVDRDASTIVAELLLLDVVFEDIEPYRATPPLDYRLALSYDDIFLRLNNDCSAFAGFTLASRGYPDWLALTRPYLETRFVLVATNDAYRSLDDIPFEDELIGTRLLSEQDLAFATFLESRAPGRRWARSPYPDNALLIERLLDGTLGAALVWEPALLAATEGDPQGRGIHYVETGRFDPPPVRMGFAVYREDAYLRNLLDDAIQAARSEGLIVDAAERRGVPALPRSTD